jgi:antirestriction protein ArdC
MGHSTGHEKRLNREGITSIEHKSHKYSKEELIAEMTAAYLCGHVGMSMSHLEQSASYIDNWLKSLKDDKNILQDACTEAEASYQYILTGEKEENKT